MSPLFALPAKLVAWAVSSAAILPAASLVAYSFYQLFFNALSPIPGPFWAKLSPLWLTVQCRRTERSMVVASLHKKYGDIVRIAPNHVSINKPEALTQVYGHKSGFTKGPFYDAFMQVTPVVFTARDVKAHQRKRKYLNPAFASRGMINFEPYMDLELKNWMAELDKMCRSKQTVDFCVWSKSSFPSNRPRLIRLQQIILRLISLAVFRLGGRSGL